MKTIILKEITHSQTRQPITGHAIILTGIEELRNAIPTGTYRMATVLRDKGWRITVLDHVLHLPLDKLKIFLDNHIKEDTKWIGVSYTWMSNISKAHRMVRQVKSWYPDLLIVLGGQFPYNVDVGADWYILGYGEKAIDAVIDYEFGSGPLPISNPLYDGRFINAYKEYPATPYSNYRTEYLEEDFISPKSYMTLELSRGCKFACKFCSFPFIGMKEDTSTNEESLYRELMENYQRFGNAIYYLADDTLNDRTEKLIKLRNVVNRLDFKPDFKAFIRLDLLKAHPEQFELLGESRVWMHYYGIETFSKRAGSAIGKGMSSDNMKELMLKMKEYLNNHLGLYRASAGFIAGLPYETVSEMEQTERWLQENWADNHRYWWPLSIHKDEGILSAIGKDLAKFGYEEIDRDTKKEEEIGHDYFKARPIDEIFWKNQYTDVYEVYHLAKNFRQGPELLDAFTMLRYLSLYNRDYKTVLSMTKLPPYHESFDYKKQCSRLIKDYLTKKMSFIVADK